MTQRPYGSGNFGRWVEDGDGNPAYDCDPGRTGHDQWHLIGNDRISATMHTGGYLQVYDWSRGGKLLNRWDPANGCLAGGFVRVTAGEACWTTLRHQLPPGAVQHIRWGMGYGEKRTETPALRILERYEGGPGNAPWIEGRVTVEPLCDSAVPVRVAAVWGVALHQLTAAPIMTHGLDRWYDRWRARLNRRFRLQFERDAQGVTVRYIPRGKAPHPDKPTWTDWHPPAIRVASLDGADRLWFTTANDEASSDLNTHLSPMSDDTMRSSPDKVKAYATIAIEGGRSTASNRTTNLQARFGAETPCGTIAKHPENTPLQTRIHNHDWLDRELKWHGYYLQAGIYWSDYFESHFIDQGSAYSYLQGASGAPRDFALFILPMVYLRPDIAKDALRHLFRSQSAKDGKFPYAHTGHGVVSGALVHSFSSDLDLFVLWALAEYLGATGDRAFLEEPLHYYPKSAGKEGAVLEHAKDAFVHLLEKVGCGRHGLLRCGTGDWNDVLLAFSRLPPLTVWRGESALNAGLATVALPALADALGDADPAFSEALRAFARGQAAALAPLWTGQWMARGYLGYGEALLGHDRLFLDAQAFPVLGGIWDSARAQTLFRHIQKACVDPQPAGALCLYPPMKGLLLDPGSDTNGGTWAAIDAWTAWAWATVDPEAAWQFFLSTTMAARAEAYPDTWYGIWSGPDSFNAHYHLRAAETFNLNATPMTRYPVMNMNRHAGPLLDIIKFAGMGPRDGRFVFDPVLPLPEYSVAFPLAGITRESSGTMEGYFTPTQDGPFRFAVRGVPGGTLAVNGNPTPVAPCSEGMWHFEAHGTANHPITWRVSPAMG